MKGPAFVATVVAVSLVALALSGVVMMTAMMSNGNWGMMGGMMGGRGSDPGKETPVAGVTQVRLENFAFAPANIVVDVGTTVTWTNYDSVGHTVTSDEGNELDRGLDKGESFSHRFDTPGVYPYHCSPHPNMRGLVTVRPADG